MAAVPSLDSTDQKMRDFRLAIEFKYLINHAPGGVFMLPELDNIRKLHGVIFVRRGLWRNGVFRFVINLPENYNGINTFPEVLFTPPVFNPLIHPVVRCSLQSVCYSLLFCLYTTHTPCFFLHFKDWQT